jgi:hypothetical protein
MCTGQSGVPSDRRFHQLIQRSARLKREINCALFSVRCASDSLVHPRTEGNQSLPNGAPTTPRSLGDIKGPLRRHGAEQKHTLSIITLRLHDHAVDSIDRDFSAFLSCDSAVLTLSLYS